MRSVKIVLTVVIALITVTFCYNQVRMYDDVDREIDASIRSFNDIFASSAQARLRETEVTLDLLANQLLYDDVYVDPDKIPQFLNMAKEQLGSNAGFTFLAPTGRYIAASDNVDVPQLGNLMEREDTRETFRETLESHAMVVGRVYFVEGLGQWILPLRKAVRNASGRLIGVVATGLIISDHTGFLEGPPQVGPRYFSMLLKSAGAWRVYIHNLPRKDYETYYLAPMTGETFNAALASSIAKYGVPVEVLRHRRSSFTFTSPSEIGGKDTLSAARYLDRYGLWVLTAVPADAVREVFVARGFISRLMIFVVSISTIITLLFVFMRKEEQARKELQHHASRDHLTGVHNRYALEAIAKIWMRPNAPAFALLFVDLDSFKNINDAFGHNCGDVLLVEVAKRLKALAPASAEVVRPGGDEFAVFVRNDDIASLDAIGAAAVAAISQPYVVSGMKLHVGASIGISLFPQDGMILEQLMISADLAMRSAKRKRNSYAFYNQDLQEVMRRKVTIEHHLRHALDANEISMAYQPQVARNGRICGVEALVRWRNPDLGQVPPDEFIGVAEESGLIAQLGQFIIRRACAQFREVLDACGERATDLSLSINISVKQCLEDDFKARLLACIDESGLPTERVIIEITESLFIEEPKIVLPLLQEIRATGVGVSLDDFGTGYSSLSTLRTLPINELKIDKSFIRNICTVDQDKKMSQSIIDIGHTMGLRVVAEGIEDEPQRALLDDLGCDVYQGYFFAKPLSLDEFIAYVNRASQPAPAAEPCK